MSYLAASGVCVVALLGSVFYENRRMKKEEEKTKRVLEDLFKSLK